MKNLIKCLVVCVLSGASFADTIHVPGDYATIQEGIDAAVNDDVVQIGVGTFYEYEINPKGKTIAIQGTLNEVGSLGTTIDAQQNGGVFDCRRLEGSIETIPGHHWSEMKSPDA